MTEKLSVRYCSHETACPGVTSKATMLVMRRARPAIVADKSRRTAVAAASSGDARTHVVSDEI